MLELEAVCGVTTAHHYSGVGLVLIWQTQNECKVCVCVCVRSLGICGRDHKFCCSNHCLLIPWKNAPVLNWLAGVRLKCVSGHLKAQLVRSSIPAPGAWKGTMTTVSICKSYHLYMLELVKAVLFTVFIWANHFYHNHKVSVSVILGGPLSH